ncbi:hypothetical protein JOF53_001993 [Crossiella equi]|uniref:DUF397 domain-containing protein n=2 Tax=Crossiella equi TaxID=130796 RepID=A0ABS5A9Z8_9PSEU|nr:hypothetical protein [Crossiella equi]
MKLTDLPGDFQTCLADGIVVMAEHLKRLFPPPRQVQGGHVKTHDVRVVRVVHEETQQIGNQVPTESELDSSLGEPDLHQQSALRHLTSVSTRTLALQSRKRLASTDIQGIPQQLELLVAFRCASTIDQHLEPAMINPCVGYSEVANTVVTDERIAKADIPQSVAQSGHELVQLGVRGRRRFVPQPAGHTLTRHRLPPANEKSSEQAPLLLRAELKRATSSENPDLAPESEVNRVSRDLNQLFGHALNPLSGIRRPGRMLHGQSFTQSFTHLSPQLPEVNGQLFPQLRGTTCSRRRKRPVREKRSREMSQNAREWKKSSFSEGGGECVEVARVAGGVLVRDSKNPDGPSLWFTSMEWIAFLYGVLAGEFGLQ